MSSLEKRIEYLEKENAELKQQLEERYKNKREFRIVTYECDWVLTDFWLPVAVIFSMSAFVITIYFLCLRQ
jgi:hypothetical protein